MATPVKFDLGIDAFGGVGQATIFLDLDASAGLTKAMAKLLLWILPRNPTRRRLLKSTP